jgi:protein SCO1/2
MDDQGPTGDSERRSPLSPRLLLGAALAIVIVGVLSFALIGGSNDTTLPGGAREGSAGHGFLGTLALPVKAAPPLTLRNYLGQPVTLAQYRGRAVLVTFLYTNCPDVCPLIAANLRVALNELGRAAARVQVIAVSVDPRGDTRAAVAKFLRAHELLGRMQYLVGSHAQLARAWAAWGVGSQRDVGQPQLVAHSALVYGIGAAGDLRTVYPSSFEPRQIAHDVPLLAEC